MNDFQPYCYFCNGFNIQAFGDKTYHLVVVCYSCGEGDKVSARTFFKNMELDIADISVLRKGYWYRFDVYIKKNYTHLYGDNLEAGKLKWIGFPINPSNARGKLEMCLLFL